ncbi:MAG: hypothetical protein WCC27_02535 [Acidobacteriaceae bacterium]
MHPHSPLYLRAILALHITAGALAFICAPVALLAAKGGRTHRRWGKIYFWAMTVVAATALFLSIVLPILFLALVAVFSFYAAFSGYRILSLKRLGHSDKPHFIDWFAALITLGTSATLAVLGAFHLRMTGGMGKVMVVFGLIGVLLAASSIRIFLHPPADKQFWWFVHMRSMIASYIAAFTAFTVVNLTPHFGNVWWIWLGPAMIGIPASIRWQLYYRRKFAAKAAQPASA